MIKTEKNTPDNKRILSSDTLIINKISMISAKIFVQFELVYRTVFSNDLPFGGLHVVSMGDYKQLKRVPNRLYGDAGE